MARKKNTAVLGTPFTEQVLAVVRTIAPGTTLSYSDVAKRAGNPRAFRRVARIMAANYDPSVPCHRVIRSDGSYGGYNRGGESKKRSLLEAEKELYGRCKRPTKKA